MMPGEQDPMSSVPPENVPPGGASHPGPVAVPYPGHAGRYRWYHKTGALLMTIFCMAVGIFLVIYPWTESWDRNYFAAVVPEWHEYWENLYVRGAVSGLGVVNFYISLAEVLRLRRFSRH
jgi:hypothetical protein